MKAKKIWTSFGVTRELLPFLDPLERVYLQQGNQFFYDVAISRAELSLKKAEKLYFTWNSPGRFQKQVFVYQKANSVVKTKQILCKDVDFYGIITVQAKRNLFGFDSHQSKDRPRLLAYSHFESGIVVNEKAKPTRKHYMPCVVNFQDKYIFVIGGLDTDFKDGIVPGPKKQSEYYQSNVEFFDICKNKWFEAPSI